MPESKSLLKRKLRRIASQRGTPRRMAPAPAPIASLAIATVVAIGVTTTGERSVLGARTGPSEDHQFWSRSCVRWSSEASRACAW